MNLYELLSIAITPLVVFALGILYKGIIEKIVLNSQKVTIKLPGFGEIEINSKEAGDKLTELFSEFYTVYNQLLKQHERQFFHDLLEKSLNQRIEVKVKDIYPEFNRDNDSFWEKSDEGEKILGTLRAVRGLGLIAPVGEKSWQANSKIAITPFGYALSTYLKHQL